MIRFLTTALLSAWHCRPKIGFGSGGTDATNRFFMKGVSLSFLFPSDLLCLRSSRSRHNASFFFFFFYTWT